jgi:hypothetical protein
MARKIRIVALGTLAAAFAVVAIVAGVYFAARQVRPFYQQALAVQPEVLERGSRELESRATALYSDVKQQGQWKALFTAEQINGWLATQLASEQNHDLPANVRDPRVAINKDTITLGFRTNSGGVDTVVTVDASVFLTDEGAVGIQLVSVRAGALPLPVMRLADQLADACTKLKLPVRWTQQNGKPVALVELHGDADADKTQFFIDSIKLGESELYVAGHTELASTVAMRSKPAVSSGDKNKSDVALENYELRLTPRDKAGALQIARRSDASDSAGTRAHEPDAARDAR